MRSYSIEEFALALLKIFWPALGGISAGIAITLITRGLNSLITRRRERFEKDDAFRKLDAKKHNEHLKLIGSLCNTVGAAVVGAAFIVPYIGQHAGAEQVDFRWVAGGLALPLVGHIALRFMRSEG